MTQKKKINKLSNHGIGSAFITTLVILLLFSLIILAFLNAIVSQAVSTAVGGGVDEVKLISARIEQASADDLASLPDELKAHRGTFIILDKSGNTVISTGENTCNLGAGVINDITDNGRSLRLYGDTSISVFEKGGENTVVYWNMDKLLEQTAKVIKGRFYADALELPFWLTTEITSDGESYTVYFRTAVVMKREQLVEIFATLALVVLLLAIAVIIIFLNLISSVINQNRIKALFFTDPVTGGKNWLWFVNTSETLLGKRRNARFKYAVVDIALQKYRTFCLCHSVAEGERLLVRIQSALQGCVHRKELCAHGNSANFALMIRYTDKDELRQRIGAVLGSLEAAGSVHKISFHVGIDTIDVLLGKTGRPARRKDENIEVRYNNACTARATIKDGDTPVAFFDDKLVEEQKWIETVEEKQEQAVRNEEFIVYYQPKYDPRTDTLKGAEALIRWQSPELGFVSPGRMIPIFENNGFITEIDHYMIKHAARDQKRWLDEGLKCVPVSVNVSRAHFAESDLAEQILNIVDSEGTPHEYIEIELTESAFFDDKNALITTITKLREYGFAVSMDDFGSGYSSLNSLKDMPLDVLKLDAEFFRGENAGERGEIIVSEAIRLAKSLNMRTVAEGIENKEQVEFLAEQNCDMIQGFFYAKPMPAEEFEKRMEQNRLMK